VLKELVEPAGAEYRISNFKKGDPTLSSLELWGAEYQENDALLLGKEDRYVKCMVCSTFRMNEGRSSFIHSFQLRFESLGTVTASFWSESQSVNGSMWTLLER
jgi:hypothetical protein